MEGVWRAPRVIGSHGGGGGLGRRALRCLFNSCNLRKGLIAKSETQVVVVAEAEDAMEPVIMIG